MRISNLPATVASRFRYCRTLFFGRRSVRLANPKPLISFTFDDFPVSALHTAGGILEKFGVVGTYYTSLGLMNAADSPVGRLFSEQDLHLLVAKGHELGCHTFDHCDTLGARHEKFEESILRNRQALRAPLPGAEFSTFAYPRSIPRPRTKRTIEKYFLCSRGCSQTFNSGRVDLNFLRAFFLEQSGGDLSSIKALIDRNSQAGGWLIFATHDVCEKPTRFGCTPELFQEVVRYSVNSGATILSVAAALKTALDTRRTGAER